MGAAREFELSSMARGDKRVGAYRVTCCECGASAAVPRASRPPSWNDSEDQKHISEQFRRIGWAVGHNAANDLCPDCARRRQNKKPAAAATTTVVPIKPSGAAASAERPKEMTIDDALLIHEKLSEVYSPERRCYDGDWTDKRVAEDLGVPRDWIRQIREKRFGPTDGNEEIAKLLALAAQVRAEAATARDELRRQTEALEKIRAAFADQDKRAAAARDEFAKHVGALDEVAGRLARVEGALR